ncbi:MAG: DUF3369 domain-containing protein [Myxococcales bacterium]|nr:DUF3369 domain-containing protein [Myxococcales bacterium]
MSMPTLALEDRDDLFAFAEEDPNEPSAVSKKTPWKVLIVDDDREVHAVTRLALQDVTFENRPLLLLGAYSEEEAIAMLQRERDIAVVLLDVVMESDDSGLRLVRFIREKLENDAVRVILRTGQPGCAPERGVVATYDINDYREKTELTSSKLFTAIYSALRAFRDIRALESGNRGLERIVDASFNLVQPTDLQHLSTEIARNLATLLAAEHDEARGHASGVTVVDGNGGLEVLGGTGRYARLASNPQNGGLESEIIGRLTHVLQNGTELFDANRYTAALSTPQGVHAAVHVSDVEDINHSDRRLIHLFARNASVTFENLKLRSELEENQREILYFLGEAVETRSRETGNHVKRVAEISALLAAGYGLGSDQADCIRMASPLHDLGKIGIPDAILNKPGRHTDAEREVMKTHAGIGYEMLKHSKRPVLQAGAVIANQHHEKWDGSGYPNGLHGEEIHVFGRITALADVFDALGSERCYKKAWPMEKVLELLREERGKHFDPNLVDLFFENLGGILQICDQFSDAKAA